MNELIHNLGIDWKLLVAQMVNFAILFFLLKKFFLKPVLELLEKRREKIAKSLKNAERLEKELALVKEKREEILRNANQRVEEMLKEARNMVEARKTEILEETKKETAGLLEDAKKTIEKEKTKLIDEARADLAELVVLATEKVIREKLDEEKDRELVREAITNIGRE